MPTATSFITRAARASPSRSPTRCAGCWPRGSSSWTSSSSSRRAAPIPDWRDGLSGFVSFFTDLAHVQSARAAGEVGRICAELVHGYNRHPEWDAKSCRSCYSAEELTSLEGIVPGIDGSARAYADVKEANEEHPRKAGPCVTFKGLETFHATARQARRLSHRCPSGQRSRCRGAYQGDDTGSAGLPDLIAVVTATEVDA